MATGMVKAIYKLKFLLMKTMEKAKGTGNFVLMEV